MMRQCTPTQYHSIDSFEVDLFVRTQDGEVVRPKITIMLDVRSRKVLSFLIEQAAE